jgi:hypothetical protein
MRSITTRTTGLLLVVLGVWGGLVPFVGHYFHFALGPDKAWTWTTARLYLDVLPGVATVLGGLILMGAGPRASARLGALLALAGGIWFAIGPEISQLWHAGGAQGAAHGSAHIQMLEMLTYHTGLGVVIAALAGYAFPRFPVVEEELAAPRRGRAAAPGTRRHRVGRDAAIGAGAAGAVAAEHRHREHVAEARAAAREPVAEHDPAGAAGEPVAKRDMAGAAAEPVGERDIASSADRSVSADTGPATATGTTRSADYSGHSTMRRRRGGLLGSLLRR